MKSMAIGTSLSKAPMKPHLTHINPPYSFIFCKNKNSRRRKVILQ